MRPSASRDGQSGFLSMTTTRPRSRCSMRFARTPSRSLLSTRRTWLPFIARQGRDARVRTCALCSSQPVCWRPLPRRSSSSQTSARTTAKASQFRRSGAMSSTTPPCSVARTAPFLAARSHSSRLLFTQCRRSISAADAILTPSFSTAPRGTSSIAPRCSRTTRKKSASSSTAGASLFRTTSKSF
eukprot:Amastigsp_a178648_84.p3 type:complete len:185 gc:universal Amastigsp_a178648_84:258-812(+)